ncbi:MAG: hypothetical protein HY619_05465, partial [Thaumarchaeota archaeon]|nr:hypothetical protein [Nitrososphaerota archaeon]
MDEDLARYAMETAQTKGAEYVEVRLQLNKENQCFLKNGIPEPAVISDSHGLGLRVLCHGALSFAAINDLSKPNVRRLAEQAVKAAESSASMLKNPIRFSREKMETAKWSAEEKKKLSNVGPDDLFKLIHDLDSSIGKGKHGVSFVNKLLSASIMTEEKIYLNSDGADLRSRVPRFQFYSF